MHWFEQMGDLMRDPDLVVEVLGEAWEPVSYRQDSAFIDQEAVALEEGLVIVNEALVWELKEFMRLWDQNLADQAFITAARELAGK